MGGEDVKITSVGKLRICCEEEQQKGAVTEGECEIDHAYKKIILYMTIIK